MQQQSSKDVDTQDEVTRKSMAKLEVGGKFRVEEASKLKGFARERAAKPKFEEQQRTVAARTGSDIRDTRGEFTSSSRAKPIPENSTALKGQDVRNTNTQSDRLKRAATRAIATALHDRMPDVMDITTVTKSFNAAEKYTTTEQTQRN